MEVGIWIEKPGNRARYTVEHIVSGLIGWRIRWAAHREDLRPEDQPCLVYAEQGLQGAMHIRPCGWLADGGEREVDPVVAVTSLGKLPFPMPGGHLPFDLFAAAFFLLARVEEWHGLPSDEHGRPMTSAMHAARHDYLHRPSVDLWATMLADRWRELDGRICKPAKRYRQVATIDLDNGFKYLGRVAWRSAGACVRDAWRGNIREVRDRLAVLSGALRDPFELDDEAIDALLSSADRCIAFILAADRGPRDHAVAVEHPRYASYLKRLAQRMEVGLHPSYSSSVSNGLTRREHDRLAGVLDRPLRHSRQHFLRFATPGTFRTAIELGFTEEHSMGCHDRLGFRAGTCSPYPWYDLDREQVTDLVIHPFSVMDNTLRDKLRLSPDAAVREASAIVDTLKAVGGTFTGLWHESFLASRGPNLPWRAAILRIIRHAAP